MRSSPRPDLNDGTFFFDLDGSIEADECDFGSPPAPVDWSSEVRAILTDSCQTCHNASAPGGLNLAAVPYFRLVNVPSTQVPSMDRVEPNQASQSYMWHKMMDSHTLVGGTGEAMPSGGFLPDEDVQKSPTGSTAEQGHEQGGCRKGRESASMWGRVSGYPGGRRSSLGSGRTARTQVRLGRG